MSDVECAQRTEAEVDKLEAKRERKRVYQRAYNAAHRDEKRSYNAVYRAAHREEMLAYHREYNEAHREENRHKGRAYYAAHREERRERGRAYCAIHHEELRKQKLWFSRWTALLKSTQGCTDCGTHEGLLDYHHTDPATKKYDVGHMARYSEESFLDEIAKCTVLCRSCHLKRHAALAAKAVA